MNNTGSKIPFTVSELPEFIHEFIEYAIKEDTGNGDHSSLASIPAGAQGKARLIVRENGIIAGIDMAFTIFRIVDESLKTELFISEGSRVSAGDIVFIVSGNIMSVLKSERLALNVMQRMSGIATTTLKYTEKLAGLKTRILDTRKTTPGFRYFEKKAVLTGGGENHRMGLYDMIMLKDNHIDYAGGIEAVIKATHDYLNGHPELAGIKIEIEARKLDDVALILRTGGVDRIMLDNFTTMNTREAVKMIDGRYETESSGGINLDNIREYAECGVDYISVGALTHHVRSLDMSLKAFT